MDAMKVRQLADHALAGFEDLSHDSAVEVALWDLCEILAHVTDDPGSIALVERVEVRLRNKGFVTHRQRGDVGNLKVSPLVAV